MLRATASDRVVPTHPGDPTHITFSIKLSWATSSTVTLRSGRFRAESIARVTLVSQRVERPYRTNHSHKGHMRITSVFLQRLSLQ